MNGARRKTIRTLIKKYNALNADVGELKEQELNAFKSTPDSLQSKQRADRAQETISLLEEGYNLFQEGVENLKNILEEWTGAPGFWKIIAGALKHYWIS